MPRSPETTTFSLLSSRDPQTLFSCLETIQRFTKAKGFFTRVAKQLGFARCSSSRAVCQAKWLVYHSWCRNENHSVSRPTLPNIADFLLWLRRVRKLSVSAVMGYRSMLSSVFRFKLPEISSSPVLQDLLRSFQVESPSRMVRPPSWDLNKVLHHLRSSTYEPSANLSLRSLTKKVLFLLSLTTAKRVGGITGALLVGIVFFYGCYCIICSGIFGQDGVCLATPSSLLLGQVSRVLRWVRCELVVMPCSWSP